MIVKVHEHKLEIEKSPVNELEVNITKIQFEFDDVMQDLTKEAYFTFKDNTYKVIIANNECNIPNEVLTEKGQVELGVVAFTIENDETLIRYNPRPVYFETWEGSLKEADNTEPITPSDKEQIEALVQQVQTEMDNLDIEATKENTITTITITRKDGTSYDVQVLDGAKGDKGDKGDAGAIKMLIVAELPSTGADDTIYLVPLENPDVSGNNYAEYVYINGAWELLGKIGVQFDASDYYTKTETNTLLNGKANTSDIPTKTSQLTNNSDFTTKSYVDGLVGDIQTLLDNLDTGSGV